MGRMPKEIEDRSMKERIVKNIIINKWNSNKDRNGMWEKHF